jgi:hypothetical protein
MQSHQASLGSRWKGRLGRLGFFPPGIPVLLLGRRAQNGVLLIVGWLVDLSESRSGACSLPGGASA